MGTTITPTTERPAEYVRRMLRGWTGSTVLRLEEHDGQFYVAARIDRLTADAQRLGFRTGDVTAVVILAATDGRAMHERVIGEDEGPVYWAASREFLSLLSPLPEGDYHRHAREWRKRCLEERAQERRDNWPPGARKIAHA